MPQHRRSWSSLCPSSDMICSIHPAGISWCSQKESRQEVPKQSQRHGHRPRCPLEWELPRHTRCKQTTHLEPIELKTAPSHPWWFCERMVWWSCPSWLSHRLPTRHKVLTHQCVRPVCVYTHIYLYIYIFTHTYMLCLHVYIYIYTLDYGILIIELDSHELGVNICC